MPGEIGAFLLLTGTEIGAKDAIALGLAEKMIHNTDNYEDEVAWAVRAMDPAGRAHPARMHPNYFLKDKLQHVSSEDKLVASKLDKHHRNQMGLRNELRHRL